LGFVRLDIYFIDRLGKLTSKEQQLSRTQHFILSLHAAMVRFTHTRWPLQNTADPYDTTTELSFFNILLSYSSTNCRKLAPVSILGLHVSSAGVISGASEREARQRSTMGKKNW